MHFHLIKITRTFSLIISLSFLHLSLLPSFFQCCYPYPWGGVVSRNLDLIVSQIDAMFFFPWSVFSLPHPPQPPLWNVGWGLFRSRNVFALGQLDYWGWHLQLNWLQFTVCVCATMQQWSTGLLSVSLCRKQLRVLLWLVKSGIFNIIDQRSRKDKNKVSEFYPHNGEVGFKFCVYMYAHCFERHSHGRELEHML